MTSLIVPTAAGDDDRIEHERRQLARADAAGDDVVAADPQDDADRAEHQHDHRRDQQRALANALERRRERLLDALAEAPRSSASWPYACTVRISCSASST